MYQIEFGADGIRGKADEWPFIKPVAYLIGQALGQYVLRTSNQPIVAIGRDTRPSGSDLSAAISAGLMSQGIHIINLGIITTPGVAYITRVWKYQMGIIISASHGSFEMNGIKVIKQNGLRLQREEEIEIEVLIKDIIARSASAPLKYAQVLGQETDGSNLINMYIEDHIKCCPVKSLEKFRLVLDCANGAVSEIAPSVFYGLGAEVLSINNNVQDGKNINYLSGSEHVRTSARDITISMQDHEAHYGFAFDGDGDRLVIIDRNGNVFDGHDLLFVLAKYYKEKGHLKKNHVVTIHQANHGLEHALKQIGIRTNYTNNGDRNLEAAMWGKGYVLGGEPGGNIIINDGAHTAADAIYTAVLIAGLLTETPEYSLINRVNILRQSMYNCPHKEISVSLKKRLEPEKISIVLEKVNAYRKNLGNDAHIMFWASQTEAKTYRILVEGNNYGLAETVHKVAQEIEDFIRAIAQQTF